VLHEDEAHHAGTEVAADLRGQGRHDLLAIRGAPALPAIADHLGHQHKVLEGVGLIALVARARRHRHREGSLLGGRRRARPGASLALLAAGRLDLGAFVGLGGLVHPARRQLGPLGKRLEMSVLLS
jgi:hypothetical protein